MKHKILFIIFVTCIGLGLTSGTTQIQSNGAPLGSTGAPGELTCGKAGCHVGDNGLNNINNNTGILNISVNGNIAQYVPNQIYTVTVSMSQNAIQRFGFSLTALGNDNLSIGNLIVTENTTTQKLDGVLQYVGKEYMTYTAAGTSPTAVGQREWTFQWQAPAQYEGPVKFYAAAVAADDDGTDNGDWVYTTVYDGLQNGLNVIPSNSPNSFNVFPNPIVGKQFFIDKTNAILGQVQITLYHLNGSIASVLYNGQLNKENLPFQLNKPDLPTGLYLLSIENDTQKTSQEIFIQN